MPNLPVSPSIKSPPPPPAISPPVAASVPVDTDEPLPEEPAAAPVATRPFAPQTHAQGAPRGTWTPPRGSLARVPIWGFAAGAAVVVILLCLLIAVILSSKGTPQKASASGDNATPANGNPGNSGNRENPGNVQPLIPNQQRPVEPPAPRGNGGNLRPAPVAENTGPGRVYGPKQVTRSPDLYYVLIAQSPDLKIAQRNANLIAENGVDVSMEIMKGGMYALISAQGFRTLEEGEPTRAKIVQIGHLLPEYKRTKRAWDDATLQRFRAPPQPAAAG